MMEQEKMLSLEAIHAAIPDGGLFGGGTWQWSPKPFLLEKKYVRQLEGLGHVLASFQRASDVIYRKSVKGTLPSWVAEMLDAGKPDWMIAAQRDSKIAGKFPRVIRPDLLLTDEGFSLTEIDSVPGGIGITAWLSKIYTGAGFSVIGGENGMTEGFSSVIPEGGIIAISDEAKDYKAEMEWLVLVIGGERKIVRAEDLSSHESRSIYRFFELFDWKSIPSLQSLIENDALINAPIKPHLEEKAWLAMFHMPGFKSSWREVLRGTRVDRLLKLIPQSWLVRNLEIPADVELPNLGVNSWQEVANFSQKQRKLVLKISGFHEMAWGSRGVFIGHDLPSEEWKQRIEHAIEKSDSQPWMMQKFCEAKIIEHPVYKSDGSISIIKGKVRLCPYYFTDDSGFTKIGGCLATIVPADKKKIHGMKDGILCPVTSQ
jgi:hypothetical protein